MLTLNQVLDEHWDAYRHANYRHLNGAHYRAVNCVQQCRTPALGGCLYRCNHCHKSHFAWHSCNHRSCAQCGSINQEQWAAKQEAKLLPVPYFMVTFTVPDKLRYLFAAFPKELYGLLLKESAGALQDVIATKYKGARIGFTSVLHTWGRQMQHHPHVHCIVPAAVYHQQTGEVQVAGDDGSFLVSYHPLRARFRSRLHSAIKEQYPEIYARLNPAARAALGPHSKWNVNLKPVGEGHTALRYLAAYVFRSAFHPSRLLGYTDDGRIKLKWTCSTTGKTSVVKLSPNEFIRRWLLHVLPKGFMRVRHFGYLGSAAGVTREKIRDQLGVLPEAEVRLPEKEPFACPHCKQGKLIFIETIARLPFLLPNRGPPPI